MAADTEPIEILLHLPLLAEDKVCSPNIHSRPKFVDGKSVHVKHLLPVVERSLRLRSLQGCTGPCHWRVPPGKAFFLFL